MKKLVVLTSLVLLVLASCKKDGPVAKVESIAFKEKSYEILENEMDLNLKKKLVITPSGIIDTCKITWKVSDTEVAEMDGNYLVPLMPGDVNVTATVQGQSATCNVSILAVPVESITLTNMTVPLYGSKQIECTTVPAGISIRRIAFTSSNDDVAYVNSDGMVQGKGVGEATITAKVDGKEATCTVTVEKKNVTSLTVSPIAHRFASVGETLQLTAKIVPSDASVQVVKWSSDKTSVAVVDENTGLVTCKGGGTAIITAKCDGKEATCTVSMPEYGTVTDCQNNTYKTVKIGSQWWMAENMRATEYSENNTDSKDINIRIIAGGGTINFLPYCIDARNKSNWYSTKDWDTSYDDLVSKFGCLYNWAAAVGVADGEKVKDYFSGNRQGICPDGWHIPSISEWYQFRTFVEESEDNYKAGKCLKSVNGWYNKDESQYKPALDTYGFTALPAGAYQDSRLVSVGRVGVFWTSSVDPYNKDSYAQFMRLSWSDDKMDNTITSVYSYKAECYSVRCVKN